MAVVPLVVLVGLRSAWAAFMCQMDREVRSACCCPHKPKQDAPVDGSARVQAPACCELLVGHTPELSDLRETTRPDLDRGHVLAERAWMPLRLAVIAVQHGARVPVARPPPPDAPLYLAIRTILR